MGLLLGLLIMMVCFAGSVVSCGFYGFAVGMFIGLLVESQWFAAVGSFVASFICLGVFNIAWAISVRMTLFETRSAYSIHWGRLLEPAPNSKVIPTLGALIGDIIYVVAGLGCLRVMFWLGDRYEPNVTVEAIGLLGGALVGVFLGLKAPSIIAWHRVLE